MRCAPASPRPPTTAPRRGALAQRKNRIAPRSAADMGGPIQARTRGPFVALLVLLAVTAQAQDSSPAPVVPAVATKTAKERLIDKAADEQRVDNCNVPAEKRGPKPRPDACANERVETN